MSNFLDEELQIVQIGEVPKPRKQHNDYDT